MMLTKTHFNHWFRKLTIHEVINKDLDNVDREIYLARLAVCKAAASLAWFEAHKAELLAMRAEHTTTTVVQ